MKSLKKSLSALQTEDFRKPAYFLLPSSIKWLSLPTGKEIALLATRPAELHRRSTSGNRLAENIRVFRVACPHKKLPVTPKLFCHPALGTLPRLRSSCCCNPTLITHGVEENCSCLRCCRTTPLGDHREIAGWWHTLPMELEPTTQQLQDKQRKAVEFTLTGS